MLLLTIPDRRRDQLGHFKHFMHVFSIIEDSYLEGFLDFIHDIVNMFIEKV